MYEYPFGNGQQLNLDWFLAEWKNLLAAWEAEKNGIDGALQAEIDRAEAALADVFAARDAAAQSAANALESKNAAAQSASDASGYLATVQADANAARDAAQNAAQSESNAADSAQTAVASKNAAANSERNAAQSETNANSSKNAAAQSAADAQEAQQNVQNTIESATEQAIATATQSANDAANRAGQSASAAADSQTAAGNSADAAAQSAADAQEAAASISAETIMPVTPNKCTINGGYIKIGKIVILTFSFKVTEQISTSDYIATNMPTPLTVIPIRIRNANNGNFLDGRIQSGGILPSDILTTGITYTISCAYISTN